ncbi:hypothetical protein U14_01742 [Candidatus Moduliflexus flocculans]|uniref:Lipoprotein n=1 Tax=Candidatus Moduliflexus flocculans TaxID=1499966 RepID=A0A0S6VX05_9BACT|nr:hypothetical protein U14_01742 [Candidatus Moduliflexus flocculans]
MRWNNVLCGVLMAVVGFSGCAKKETPQERAERLMKELKKIPVCELVTKAEMETMLGVTLADPNDKAPVTSAPPMCSYVSASESMKDFLSVSIMLLPPSDNDPKKAYDAFLNGAGGLLKEFPNIKIEPVDGFGFPAFWYEEVHQLYVFTPAVVLSVTGMAPQQPGKLTLEIHKQIATAALSRLPQK